jgi:hypothetical protein
MAPVVNHARAGGCMQIKINVDLNHLADLLKQALASRTGRACLILASIALPVFVGAVTKPNTFSDGATISASQVNANFDTVYNAVTAIEQARPHRFSGSTLVSLEQGEMLNGWVGSIGKNWTICYRKSVHGGNSSTFHSRCNNLGETITVAKLSTGKLIGGYAGCSWANQNSYIYGCGGSFVFSLTNKHKYPKHFYHVNLSNTLSYIYWIYDADSYGPTFGGGHDLYINSGLNGGYCNLGHDYTCRKGSNESNGGYGTDTCRNDFCGSYSSWSIDELEVWYNAG